MRCGKFSLHSFHCVCKATFSSVDKLKLQLKFVALSVSRGSASPALSSQLPSYQTNLPDVILIGKAMTMAFFVVVLNGYRDILGGLD